MIQLSFSAGGKIGICPASGNAIISLRSRANLLLEPAAMTVGSETVVTQVETRFLTFIQVVVFGGAENEQADGP